MPNYCYYDMQVSGQRSKVEEFIKLMNYEFEDRYFCRLFEAYEYRRDEGSDGLVHSRISGCCAWSVHSCMMDGEAAYYEDRKEDGATTLAIEAARLDLVVEVFSSEPGIGFAEHVLIERGEVLVEDCVDYEEFYFEEVNEFSIEDFEYLKGKGAVPEDAVIENYLEEDIPVGGYGDYEFKYPLPTLTQLCTDTADNLAA